MLSLSSGTAANGQQTSCLQCVQTVADMTFISPQVLDSCEMIGADTPAGAFILRPHALKDVALQFRKASCRHTCLLLQAAQRCDRAAFTHGPQGGRGESASMLMENTAWGNGSDYGRQAGNVKRIWTGLRPFSS